MKDRARRMRWVARVAFGLLGATGAARAQPIAAASPVEADEVMFTRLVSERPRPTPRAIALVDVIPATPHVLLPALAADDVVGAGDTSPMINGRVYPVNLRSDVDGNWTALADGSLLWTLSVASPNAAGLRLRFEPFEPPHGTELIVYSAANPAEARGPLRARFEQSRIPYWTPRVSGNEARIEWFVPVELAGVDGHGVLEITGVLQIFPDPPAASHRGIGCRLDVTCHPEWQTTAQAVARYDYVEGGTGWICSGAMLTRLPSPDFCPLFLTAAHCIDSQAAAASMNIYWYYQTSTCEGTPPSLASLPLTDGAVLLRRDEGSDTCLLGLPVDDLPSGITFAGWSSEEAPDPTPATLIHHPLGMRKSWSLGELRGIEAISQCWPMASNTYDFELTTGGQDGGSSGAPVFDNAAHRIRAVASCSESDDCIPAEDTGEGSFANGYLNMVVYLVASSDIWVQSDWSFGEFGTSSLPFDSLIEGFYAIHGGGTLHVRPGSGYPGPFLFAREMTLVADGGVVRIGD